MEEESKDKPRRAPLLVAALAGVVAASGVFSLIALGADDDGGDAGRQDGAGAFTLPAPPPEGAVALKGEDCEAPGDDPAEDESEQSGAEDGDVFCAAPPPMAFGVGGPGCEAHEMSAAERKRFEQHLPDEVKEAIEDGKLPPPPPMPAPDESGQGSAG